MLKYILLISLLVTGSAAKANLHDDLRDAVISQDLHAVKRLLIEGADPNYLHHGKPTLCWLLQLSKVKVSLVKLLLAYSATPFLGDEPFALTSAPHLSNEVLLLLQPLDDHRTSLVYVQPQNYDELKNGIFIAAVLGNCEMLATFSGLLMVEVGTTQPHLVDEVLGQALLHGAIARQTRIVVMLRYAKTPHTFIDRAVSMVTQLKTDADFENNPAYTAVLKALTAPLSLGYTRFGDLRTLWINTTAPYMRQVMRQVGLLPPEHALDQGTDPHTARLALAAFSGISM